MTLHAHSLRPFRVGTWAAAVKQHQELAYAVLHLTLLPLLLCHPLTRTSLQRWALHCGASHVPWTSSCCRIAHLCCMVHPQLAVREVVPLRLQDLSPVNITKPAMVVFLQSQVKSRSAAQQSVQAVVLTGNYLPSQLEVMADMALKQEIKAHCFISSQQLHVLLARQPLLGISADADPSDEQQADPEWMQLLSGAFGNCLQPLPEERLQAACAAEDALNRQLRLFNAPAWNDALQLQLLSRKAVKPLLAIRSLMGPPALAAVRKLVDKYTDLHLLELERQLQRPFDDLAGSSASGSSSSTRTRSRRRPQAVAGKASAAAHPAAHMKELVLVVSRGPISAEDAAQLPPEFFTGYVYDDTGSAGGDSGSGNRWWEFWSRALVQKQ